MSVLTEESKPGWFNRSAFGAAGELRVKDPRVAALKGPHLAVFLAAASFAGLGHDSRRDPRLFASAARVAERAGVSVRTVENALPYLCGLCLLEHTGQRITGSDGRAGPVIYRQTALAEAYREQDARSAGGAELDSRAVTRSARDADEGTARGADEGTARGADDPRNPSDPQGAEEEEEGAAPLTASAGATAVAAGAPATASTEPTPSCLAEIASAEQCSIEHVQQWATSVLGGRTISTTADQYLRGCVRRGDGPASWTPPRPRTPAKSTSTPVRPSSSKGTSTAPARGKSTTGAKKSAKTPVKRRSPIVRRADVAAVLTAWREGVPDEQVAEKFDVALAAIATCRRTAAETEGRTALKAGRDVDAVAARWPGELAERIHFQASAERIYALRALGREGATVETVAADRGWSVAALRQLRERHAPALVNA